MTHPHVDQLDRDQLDDHTLISADTAIGDDTEELPK